MAYIGLSNSLMLCLRSPQIWPWCRITATPSQSHNYFFLWRYISVFAALNIKEEDRSKAESNMGVWSWHKMFTRDGSLRIKGSVLRRGGQPMQITLGSWTTVTTGWAVETRLLSSFRELVGSERNQYVQTMGESVFHAMGPLSDSLIRQAWSTSSMNTNICPAGLLMILCCSSTEKINEKKDKKMLLAVTK